MSGGGDGSPRGYSERSRALLEGDTGTRDAVTTATVHFDAGRRRGWAEVDAEAWRSWAEGVKSHALGRLDDLLREAEARLAERGAVVHWAADAAGARDVVRRIVERVGARRVVKGKSMLSEELRLNPLLEGMGVEVLETDLGEFVIQLMGEPPSHIVGPAIHRGLDDIRRLFAERLGTAPDAAPDELAARARTVLREAFLTAGLGLTGGNFLVAETGSLVLMENEGNIRLATSLPRVHVALVGIEKVLPRWSDVAGFLQLTARSATGQAVPVYASAVQGPRATDDPDGPDELHVVLVDGGRASLLADDEMWEALRCVRCGACLNVCPVFRQTGGHPYGWAYSGPIGAVLAPAYLGLEEGVSLPYASTLCGACGDACPVRIPLPRLLHAWRRRAVERGMASRGESVAMSAWAALATRPALFEVAGEALRAVPALGASRRLPVVGPWVRERGPLRASAVSFARHPGPDGPGGARHGLAPTADADGEAPPEALPPDRPDRGSVSGPVVRDAAAADDRERILGRVSRALQAREAPGHPGAFPGGPASAATDVLTRFVDSFRRGGGEAVLLADREAAARWIADFAVDLGSVAVAADVAWTLRPDLPTATPERAGLGVSRAVAAAADTGTVLLDSREGRGLQLLPAVHLVLVDAASVLPTLDQALESVRVEGLPPVLALHSGPSRSADIGGVLVTGVHGPGRVVAAVVGPSLDDGRAASHASTGIPTRADHHETEPRRGP